MKSKFAVKALATIKDLSPEIGAYGGVALMVGGGVWLAVNTYKYLPDIIEEYEGEMAQIESYIVDEDYTLKDKKKDIKDLRMHTAKRIVKKLGLPTATMAIGAASNISGFKAEKGKYLAAAAFGEATAATLSRVIERAEKKGGEDLKRYLLNGEEPEEIEDKETGEKKKIYRGSETDDAFPLSVYAMTVDRGYLYEQVGGNAIMLLSALHDYEDALNVQYNAGTPVYYYDILRYTYGDKVLEKLEEKGLIQKDIRNLGWFLRDPNNRENTDARAIDLRAETWFGPRPGEEKLYESDMGGLRDKVWVRINPNIPGMVDLSCATRKIRTKGKYSSII